jgi:hypothetical protein
MTSMALPQTPPKKVPMKKRRSSATKSAPRSGPAGPAAAVLSGTQKPSGGIASTRLEVISIPPGASSEPPTIAPLPELRRVRFGYFHPDATEVFVVGSFNGWNTRSNPLRRDALGDWSVELALPPGEHRYRLMVDGDWRDDPCAPQTAMNPFGGFDAVVVV